MSASEAMTSFAGRPFSRPRIPIVFSVRYRNEPMALGAYRRAITKLSRKRLVLI